MFEFVSIVGYAVHCREGAPFVPYHNQTSHPSLQELSVSKIPTWCIIKFLTFRWFLPPCFYCSCEICRECVNLEPSACHIYIPWTGWATGFTAPGTYWVTTKRPARNQMKRYITIIAAHIYLLINNAFINNRRIVVGGMTGWRCILLVVSINKRTEMVYIVNFPAHPMAICSEWRFEIRRSASDNGPNYTTLCVHRTTDLGNWVTACLSVYLSVCSCY